MSGINFNEKIICDSIHGSIGISRLEQQVINTRTFQRLKKIKQLGLSHFVFPGAEHTRFAHSIGAMHVMSQMIDRLSTEGCPHFVGDSDKTKQKLRLAALLHDIGHYPLAHLGEQVFQWIDELSVNPLATDPENNDDLAGRLLGEAAKKHKSEAAGHERLGELILTSNNSELKRILSDAGYDPAETARIFNAEDKDYVFYTQLMSSTLDCDRLDYLLRDARSSGTIFGQVDIQYILRNLTWDDTQKFVCFYPKAVNAIEHFIMGRYFSYNITFHKTVMGFELMAKALMFAMMRDSDFTTGGYGGIVRSFGDIKKRIESDGHFLANFNDEYFWYYLELWDPKDAILKKLRHSLLSRIPLRVLGEARILASDPPLAGEYHYLANNLSSDPDFHKALEQAGVATELIAVIDKKIAFEEVPYSVRYDKTVKDVQKLKLVKIRTKAGASDLVSSSSSIINVLSNYQPSVVRVYALIDAGSGEEAALKEKVAVLLDRHRA